MRTAMKSDSPRGTVTHWVRVMAPVVVTFEVVQAGKSSTAAAMAVSEIIAFVMDILVPPFFAAAGRLIKADPSRQGLHL
jgi:hypothetical protein